MKAYKVVTEINGKFYSYATGSMFLEWDMSRGMAVQYELNKKTTYPRKGMGYKFLYCIPELTIHTLTFAVLTNNIKIFECIATKSKSKDATNRYKNVALITASSITLLKEIPKNEWVHLFSAKSSQYKPDGD